MAYIEIDKNNLFYNLDTFAKRCGSKDKIAIVLKDNAYGHGIDIIAKLSREFGLSRAVVRDYQEAKSIVKYFDDILVLGDRAVVDSRCSFVINSLDDILNAQNGATVELKIDTGMHRNGIDIADIDIALSMINKYKLKLKGVMSHNRSADVLSSELFWQKKRFDSIKSKIKSLGYGNIRFHSFNSASALRLNPANEDMIRLGIGAYGYNELPDFFNRVELKPVLSLWAEKIASRELKKGQRVGYGGDFVASRDMIISSYDLGYGDGFMRSNSFTPISIATENLPILGRVSMDYIILPTNRDRVCIFNNAQKLAKLQNTISYEITTQLSPTIHRVIKTF